MKYWHYLQFTTGNEGPFTQNHCYKPSDNSSYCIAWSTHLLHTIYSLNLKSCDPLQFHFSFQLLDLFILLSSHLILHMDCPYMFNCVFWFCYFFFLSFYFCSCLKVSNFYLNLFVSLQRFLNLNFFLSCSFIYHLVCFILKYASVSFFYRERKKKANLLLLCPVPVNSRSFSYLLCAVYCYLFASKIKAVLWLHHHGQITERQLISEQWCSEKQMRHEAAVVRDYGKTLFWFLDVLRNFGSHWTLPKEEQGFGTFANQPANGAPSCRPWDSAMPSPAWAEAGPG